LAAQAELALSKVLSVLPAESRAAAESLAVYAPPVGPDDATLRRLEVLRGAAQARQVLQIDDLDLQGARSRRRVRPLGCFYWGLVWTLAGWCELRQDFRSFRIDRIEALEALDERFRDEPGRSLADLLRSYGAASRSS
jgi:predicted DNA-binding transcriptional regulator YafY